MPRFPSSTPQSLPSWAMPSTSSSSGKGSRSRSHRHRADKLATTFVPLTLGVLMPAVTGLPQADAMARLAASALDTVVFEPGKPLPEAEVTAQDPVAGALVAFADQVTLTVTDLVIVPGLGGLTVSQASQRLADAGLELAAPASGFVVTQKPLQGTLVERGSTVSVTVSPGRVVPSVVGLTLAAARQVLAREKLP